MLYDRDYKILTPTETELWKKAEAFKNRKGNIVTAETLTEYHKMLPEAVYYHTALFPNHFLAGRQLENKPELIKIHQDFNRLLSDNSITERQVLNFINNNHAYFIIGSILKDAFFFGHHGAHLFKEFSLPPSYKTDYLIIGKNSDGYHFVFVELENPYGEICLKGGEFGKTIRKGLEQINCWENWLEENYASLYPIFQKCKNTDTALPAEFLKLDSTRIHYVVVAGRRGNFNEKANRNRRKLKRQSNITILHYDNILESFEKVIKYGSY